MPEKFNPENIKQKKQMAEDEDNVKKNIIYQLKRGNINAAFEIKDKFDLPKKVLRDTEVQAAFKKEILNQLKKGYIYGYRNQKSIRSAGGDDERYRSAGRS